MSENLTDVIEQLVAECREGDPDAQRQLYEACLPSVHRLVVRMVGVQDSQDVTQQAFLRAFSRLDQFNGNAKFETWLYRLTVNESLQHLRKRRRWNAPSLDFEPVDETPSHDRATDQKEILEGALNQLDPQLCSIFLLRESEGLSYHEIAQALEIPEGTVGSRLNRARRELQQHLIALGWTP